MRFDLTGEQQVLDMVQSLVSRALLRQGVA